ncbi:Lrp/AsnC ligand binding domain-containing protein [Pokkaliibacter sp. MBI-7]|uniref:AsnC family transcriptional regulator n=1 Tax=Proteobacteria bacterium 228 TaxID=2083153 RepID=A0A2S5KVF6_9PROT|nr:MULTISPECIES: Lrp/AsnC ligand binding domain-containing protein [Pokkaliibacter]MDH2432018.1 Lrp/AsnC ligand binding domain-containing protein [Pokkaliibacter sp. MBI-7]PPC78841.1 AsnC family transcriptional regulator [Pokkaliibacter plantistimulans]
MVTFIILFNIEKRLINTVAEQLVDIEGISEVYSVSGNFDLVAIARVRSNDELANLVTEDLLPIEGITKTQTMLAFKAYSRHDLDAMFAI